jgi:hypothetical protein
LGSALLAACATPGATALDSSFAWETPVDDESAVLRKPLTVFGLLCPILQEYEHSQIRTEVVPLGASGRCELDCD